MSNIDFGQVITAEDKTRNAEALRRQDAAAQAEGYLATTDWYAIRQAETGKPVPATVKKQRAAARKLLSSQAG